MIYTATTMNLHNYFYSSLGWSKVQNPAAFPVWPFGVAPVFRLAKWELTQKKTQFKTYKKHANIWSDISEIVHTRLADFLFLECIIQYDSYFMMHKKWTTLPTIAQLQVSANHTVWFFLSHCDKITVLYLYIPSINWIELWAFLF